MPSFVPHVEDMITIYSDSEGEVSKSRESKILISQIYFAEASCLRLDPAATASQGERRVSARSSARWPQNRREQHHVHTPSQERTPFNDPFSLNLNPVIQMRKCQRCESSGFDCYLPDLAQGRSCSKCKATHSLCVFRPLQYHELFRPSSMLWFSECLCLPSRSVCIRSRHGHGRSPRTSIFPHQSCDC